MIIASGGYPEKYAKGYPVTINEMSENVTVYHAGTKLENGTLVSSGGRVIGVSAKAATLSQAIKNAYKGCEAISFKDSFFRKDIGKRALEAAKL